MSARRSHRARRAADAALERAAGRLAAEQAGQRAARFRLEERGAAAVAARSARLAELRRSEASGDRGLMRVSQATAARVLQARERVGEAGRDLEASAAALASARARFRTRLVRRRALERWLAGTRGRGSPTGG